jgi:hypothetical protein
VAITRRPRYKNRAQRRTVHAAIGTDNARPMRAQLVPTLSAHSGSTLPITFPIPFVYAGILPAYTAGATHVTGVTVTSPTTVTLTFSGTPTTPLIVPFQDPAFRDLSGGYVQPGSYAIA